MSQATQKEVDTFVEVAARGKALRNPENWGLGRGLRGPGGL